MNKAQSIKNQGMSLIELLVSVAVLGIAMIGILSLMNLSTKYFSNSSKEVEVQQELQTTFSLVSNMIADANDSVTYTLDASHPDWAVLNIKDKVNEYYVILEGKNLYAKKFARGSGGTNIRNSSNLLADHVEEFVVNTDHYDDGFVTLSLRIKYGSREAAMTKNVFMRNAGKEQSNFLSQCTVGTASVSGTTVSFSITQNTGETITQATTGVIKMKLAVSTSSADVHKSITVSEASVSGASILSKYFNPVTGEVTIHCKINDGESWTNGEEITCSVTLSEGTITESGCYIESISK